MRSIVFIITEENRKFTSLRFAIHCKLVLPIKVCRKKVRALGSGMLEYAEGKERGGGGGDEEEEEEEKFSLRTKKHTKEQNVKFLRSTPGNHSALKA